MMINYIFHLNSPLAGRPTSALKKRWCLSWRRQWPHAIPVNQHYWALMRHCSFRWESCIWLAVELKYQPSARIADSVFKDTIQNQMLLTWVSSSSFNEQLCANRKFGFQLIWSVILYFHGHRGVDVIFLVSISTKRTFARHHCRMSQECS